MATCSTQAHTHLHDPGKSCIVEVRDAIEALLYGSLHASAHAHTVIPAGLLPPEQRNVRIERMDLIVLGLLVV